MGCKVSSENPNSIQNHPQNYAKSPQTPQQPQPQQQQQQQSQPQPQQQNNTIVLGYWGLRYRATVSKYLLEYTGLPYTEQIFMKPEEWFGAEQQKMLQSGFQFPNLPFLKEGNFILTETFAIEQYIIMRSGHKELLGCTDKEKAEVKMLWSVLQDFRETITNFIFKTTDLEKEKKKLWDDEIKGYCDLFRGQVEYDHSLVGDKITWVDFILYESLQWVKGIWPKEFAQNTTLFLFCSYFEDLPKIKEYQSSTRFIKYPFFPPGMSKWTGLPEQPKEQPQQPQQQQQAQPEQTIKTQQQEQQQQQQQPLQQVQKTEQQNVQQSTQKQEQVQPKQQQQDIKKTVKR